MFWSHSGLIVLAVCLSAAFSWTPLAAHAQQRPDDPGAPPGTAQTPEGPAPSVSPASEPPAAQQLPTPAPEPAPVRVVPTAPAPTAAPAEPDPLPAPGEGRRTGVVRGTVVDENEVPVDEAWVFVRGHPVDTRADAGGRFTLTLPEGPYQLSVIHAGFATQTSDVKVRRDREATLSIKLVAGSATLDEFVITGALFKGGIATLVAERRQSTAVADLIGTEQMSRAGASNAAAALSRVTGLTVVDGKFVVVRGMGERYSSLLVNNQLVPSPDPNRRVVPLDLFPAGVLESVVVQKTFSPDSQGEFGGGMVLLRTRTYPEQFTLNLSVAGGYNTGTTFRTNDTYRGGNADFLGIDDGTRKLSDPIRGAGQLIPESPLSEAGYSEEELAAFANTLPNIWNRKPERTLPDMTLFGSVGNQFRLRRARLGFVAAAGYRSQSTATNDQVVRTVAHGSLEDGSEGTIVRSDFRIDNFTRQISLNGFLDWGVTFSPEHKLKFTSMLLRQTDDSVTFREGKGDVNSQVEEQRTRLGWIERQLFDQQVSGHHVFKRLHDFGLDWRYSYAVSKRTEPDRRDYQYVRNEGDEDFVLSNQSGDNERWYGDQSEDAHQGGLDLTQPFTIWSRMRAKAKAGAFAFVRKRDSTIRKFEYTYALGAIPDSERSQAPEVILRPENIGNGIDFAETTRSSDQYDAEMQLQAGYAMLELPIVRQLDLMGGARVEHAKTTVNSFDQFAPGAPAEFQSHLDNTDVLPAVTLTLRVLKDLQVRTGYSRTLNRPDLRELSPQAYLDIETLSTTIGNPNLKRAVIDNADLRFEYYLSPDEVFSVGGFYKKLYDPIEQLVQPSSDFLYTYGNSDGAFLVGFELEGRKRFDFLHAKLQQLYASGNFTWIESEVRYRDLQAGVERTRPLQSQSPWVVNAQLGYDDDAEGGSGTSISLLYNIFGPRLRAVGDVATELPDQYEQPYHQLDLVVSQKLKHGFTLGFRGQNLLNSVQRWTADDITVRRFRKGAYLTATLAWSY